MNPATLSQAYRYCAWINRNHYENFPVGSWLLPRSVRPHVDAIYAFARSADDFADEAKYEGRSLELLEAWRQALKTCVQTNGKPPVQSELAQHPIFLALAQTIQECRLPVQLLEDLLTAFTMDVTKRRYADWEELLTYCRHSANPVGRLVLLLFGIDKGELHRLSDKICTGLQLANHWQDFSRDTARNMLYVPKTLIEQFGLTEEILLGEKGQIPLKPFQSLMRELVKRTQELFDQGELLLEAVSGRLRLELKLTLLGGREILHQIEALNFNTITTRPALSGWTKLRLLTHATLS